MKTLVISLFAMIVSTTIFAQNFKNDPTYSERNYKHPNKATWAKKNKSEKLVALQYNNSVQVSSGSYKSQFGSKSYASAAQLPAADLEKNVNSVFSRRNYKHQSK